MDGICITAKQPELIVDSNEKPRLWSGESIPLVIYDEAMTLPNFMETSNMFMIGGLLNSTSYFGVI